MEIFYSLLNNYSDKPSRVRYLFMCVCGRSAGRNCACEKAIQYFVSFPTEKTHMFMSDAFNFKN